ncbi:MAG: alpha/beta hydrolase, partial [Thermomicrobiales bacterium]
GLYGTMRGESAFMDTSRAAQTGNYPRVPVAAVDQLARFARMVERELPQISLPLLICYTPHDRLVRPESFPLLYERVSTPLADKKLLAFDRSGHELLFDQQREEVFAAILRFLDARQAALAERA